MRWYTSLRRRADFARAHRRGRRVSLPTMTAYGFERAAGSVRVGVSVPSAVGGAVVRNLVRRRILGALDGLVPRRLPTDLVFVVRPPAAGMAYGALAADVGTVLRRLLGAGPRQEASG